MPNALEFEVVTPQNTIQVSIASTGPRGQQGEAGRGVPAGGTAGQVLSKGSDADYDTEWVDPQGGSGGEIWFPTVTEAGEISWEKSDTDTPPTPQNIKGEAGNPGVWVGTGTPPPGTQVQVDPSGEATEVITREEIPAATVADNGKVLVAQDGVYILKDILEEVNNGSY